MDLVSGLLAGWSNCVGQMSLAMKISLSCSMVFAVYYKYKICKPPQLFCQKDVFRKFLATCVPTSVERFSPFFMTFGTTLQTVIGGVMRTLPRVPWDEVEDIELLDNGLVHLHWVNNNESSQYTERERPIVLFLPGLTGNNESNYILHFITGVKRKGYRSVVFTYRGMGDQDLRTAKSYCACYTDDLEYVVNLIKAKYPEAPLMAVGISLGGMILFHYLAKSGENSKLIAAMTISVPWNPFESMKTLSTPLNHYLYNRRFAKRLISFVEKNMHVFEGVVNIDHVRASNTIHEFDESFTAKVFGFDSLDHYYETSRASDKVHLIKTPLLALNSADDPFSPGYCIPVQDISQSDYVALLLTKYGGHVGFVDTFLGRGLTYLDRITVEYVNAVFRNRDVIKKV